MARSRFPQRKRSHPEFFAENHVPKKRAVNTPTKMMFLAVKTNDDPEGFYLARAIRSQVDLNKDAKFPIRWLTKKNSAEYVLDYADEIHPSTVMAYDFRLTYRAGDYLLSSTTKAEILGKNTTPTADESKPTKSSISSGKISGKKRTAAPKQKKEKVKKPKRIPKNYVPPNDELVVNTKVNPLPKGQTGFLASSDEINVSDFVKSKGLIKAVIENDYKLVQSLVQSSSKCPNLEVERSVDMDNDALTMAMIQGNMGIVNVLAKQIYTPHSHPSHVKRPGLLQPLLSSVSRGQYNFRSLGIPFVRDIQMSRGGREGVNALTQDEHLYDCGEETDLTGAILKHNIPIERVDALAKVIVQCEGDQNSGYHGRRSRSSRVLERLMSKIDWAMIHGHFKLVAHLISAAKRDMTDTFNYLHEGALNKPE